MVSCIKVTALNKMPGTWYTTVSRSEPILEADGLAYLYWQLSNRVFEMHTEDLMLMHVFRSAAEPRETLDFR